jgi:hypothetical protein
MALTRVQSGIITSTLSFTATNLNATGISTIGIASATSINATGVITASSFVGDGSQLTGVSGFATALSPSQSSPLFQVFKTPKALTIGAGTSVSVEVGSDEGSVAFTRAGDIVVASGATFRIASGTTLQTNVLGLF